MGNMWGYVIAWNQTATQYKTEYDPVYIDEQQKPHFFIRAYKKIKNTYRYGTKSEKEILHKKS